MKSQLQCPLPIQISNTVSIALAEGKPVLALESTVITHGLPYPQNIEAFTMLEKYAWDFGAVPATICLLDGVYHIGLEQAAVDILAKKLRTKSKLEKIALRDLAMAAVRGQSGGTTVSATMYLAHIAGIKVFATGGIGGVHRGWQSTMDVSLDIQALASIPVIVVCAGCKAILDIPATLEALESRGVPVYAWQTDEFPGFYSRQTGNRVSRLNKLKELALTYRIMASSPQLSTGILVANPIPSNSEIPRNKIEPYISEAISSANNVTGKALTPYLLAKLSELTNNKSVEANLALLKNNVQLGAQIAGELL
ncbi:MAG: pseudouridine-5'-phosphate glycosidase [Candidatus Cloacimonetes bacterium]|nr:pseudouridine-5'-phosphate glycosidase [Candidatus Cloacimonadota bacterium]